MGRVKSLLDRSLPVAWRQEGRAPPPHPEGKGWARPGAVGAPAVSPRVPKEGPLSRGCQVPSRPGRQRALWGGSSPFPTQPFVAPPLRRSLPLRGVWQHPKTQHPDRPPPGRQPLSLPPPWPVPLCPINAGPSPSAHPGGSSLPIPPGVRIIPSLNLPRLRLLWAAVSLMPGARANQCNSPRRVGNANQAGEKFPNIAAHFRGVSAAPRGCTALPPATGRAPSERTRSPAGAGRGGRTSHGEPGGAVGCTSRRESILSGPRQRDCGVCWFGPRNRRRLGSRPGRQPARGRTDSGDVLRNEWERPREDHRITEW